MNVLCGAVLMDKRCFGSVRAAVRAEGEGGPTGMTARSGHDEMAVFGAAESTFCCLHKQVDCEPAQKISWQGVLQVSVLCGTVAVAVAVVLLKVSHPAYKSAGPWLSGGWMGAAHHERGCHCVMMGQHGPCAGNPRQHIPAGLPWRPQHKSCSIGREAIPALEALPVSFSQKPICMCMSSLLALSAVH